MPKAKLDALAKALNDIVRPAAATSCMAKAEPEDAGAVEGFTKRNCGSCDYSQCDNYVSNYCNWLPSAQGGTYIPN